MKEIFPQQALHCLYPLFTHLFCNKTSLQHEKKPEYPQDRQKPFAGNTSSLEKHSGRFTLLKALANGAAAELHRENQKPTKPIYKQLKNALTPRQVRLKDTDSFELVSSEGLSFSLQKRCYSPATINDQDQQRNPQNICSSLQSQQTTLYNNNPS